MSGTEKMEQSLIDSAINRARMIDRSLTDTTPTIIPRLTSADVPEDDDP